MTAIDPHVNLIRVHGTLPQHRVLIGSSGQPKHDLVVHRIDRVYKLTQY